MTTDPHPTPPRVCLRRDVETDIGIFRKGLHLPATKTADGWLLHLSLPGTPAGQHLHPVPAEWVRHTHIAAAGEQAKECAWEEYRFVRHVLGHSDEYATEWLAKSLKVSFKTLRSWGFHTSLFEARERAAREAS